MCNARVHVNNMISSIRYLRTQRAHVHICQVSNFWAIDILVRVSIIQKKHCSVSFTKSIRTGRQRWLILQIDLDMNGHEVYYRRNMTTRHTRSPQTWAYCPLYSSHHYNFDATSLFYSRAERMSIRCYRMSLTKIKIDRSNSFASD